MVAVLVVLFIGAIGYLAACTMAGLQPTDAHIAGFAPEIGVLSRHFGDDVAAVRSAYGRAVGKTSGMSIREENGRSILIDMKPTVLVMDGSFGLLLLVSFEATDAGTKVTVCGRKKVSFAFTPRAGAAFVQAERALRMAAKGAGIEESIGR